MNLKKNIAHKHAAFCLIKYYLWWALAIFCPALFFTPQFWCLTKKNCNMFAQNKQLWKIVKNLILPVPFLVKNYG